MRECWFAPFGDRKRKKRKLQPAGAAGKDAGKGHLSFGLGQTVDQVAADQKKVKMLVNKKKFFVPTKMELC